MLMSVYNRENLFCFLFSASSAPSAVNYSAVLRKSYSEKVSFNLLKHCGVVVDHATIEANFYRRIGHQ